MHWYDFCLESVSKDFSKDEQSETSLNGTVCDFSVYHSLLEKEDIINIHGYLIVKNNKIIFVLINKMFTRLLTTTVSASNHAK